MLLPIQEAAAGSTLVKVLAETTYLGVKKAHFTPVKDVFQQNPFNTLERDVIGSLYSIFKNIDLKFAYNYLLKGGGFSSGVSGTCL